jgi:hypothetical protein
MSALLEERKVEERKGEDGEKEENGRGRKKGRQKWKIGEGRCSLSLWRVARGSKLMRLELIHGSFIT